MEDGSRQRGGLAEGSPRAERRRHRGVPSVETCVGATCSPGESKVTTAGRAQKAVAPCQFFFFFQFQWFIASKEIIIMTAME